MDERIASLIAGCKTNPGASDEVLDELQTNLGVSLPQDYLALMRNSNGLEGPMGADCYLMMYRAEDIPDLIERGLVSECLPGLLLFGSDGGDQGYAFDSRVPGLPIAKLSLSCLDSDPTPIISRTFVDFLEYLTSFRF